MTAVIIGQGLWQQGSYDGDYDSGDHRTGIMTAGIIGKGL